MKSFIAADKVACNRGFVRSFVIVMLLISWWVVLPCAWADEEGVDEESVNPAGTDIEEQDRYEDLRSRVETLEQKAEAHDASAFRAYWKNGIYLQSEDKDITAKVSGSIHLDTFLLSGDKKLDRYLAGHSDTLDDGMAFRRARLCLSGSLYSNFIYKATFKADGLRVGFGLPDDMAGKKPDTI